MVALASPKPNVSGKRKAFAEKPKCDWCHERFKQSRSDQRYCAPNCRRAACERRKAETARALCDLFVPRGVSADWLRDYAELHLAAAREVLTICGRVYDEARREWRAG